MIYKNGNSIVTINLNGTRIVEWEDTLQLEYPLNIDIRLSTECSLASYCKFCHEDAQLVGKHADLFQLKEKLNTLPQGIELALGINKLTPEILGFLEWCRGKGFLCNGTFNQLHLADENLSSLVYDLLEKRYFQGIGISYRNSNVNITQKLISHPRVVLHTIAGLDDPKEILFSPYKRILILGYKQFSRGKTFYDSHSQDIEQNIKSWKSIFNWLINTKKVLSFDNLGLEQLDVKSKLKFDFWETFYQGEHSIYINAVEQTYSPSSRDPEKVSWDTYSVSEYFQIQEKRNDCS